MPHHHNIFNYRKIEDKKELKEVYFSVAIRAFAFSIVSVFVPLYLMDLGYGFNQALLFLAVYFGCLIFISPMVGYLSTKIGIKHVAVFGPMLTILYLILLFLLPQLGISLYLVALIGSFGIAFYWVPLNSHFAKHSHKDHRGKETSYLIVGARTVSVMAPFIGGALIASVGFNWTFIISCLIMITAVIPLFLSYEYKSQFKYRFKDMFNRKNLPLFDDFFFHGVLVAVSIVIFPIYIFMISNSYEITGALATVTGLGIALSAFVVGKYTDRKGRVKMMRIGGFLNLIVWVFLMLVHSPLLVYISSFFVGFLGYSVTIPLYSFFCDKLRDHEHTEFMAFREIGLSSGKLAILLLLVLFAFEAKFLVAFAFAAIASIYFMFADLG